MGKKKSPNFNVTMSVEIEYLSDEVHGQSFYEMFAEILRDAQEQFPEYRFMLKDFKMEPETRE